MADETQTLKGPRGDTTREALIKTAIEIFGRDGFDAASTRAISRAAGVNQALIGYHFGGKPGLYLAALKFIADSVTLRMGPLLSAIETELELSADENTAADQAAGARSLELLLGLTDAFVRMLASEESSSWARLILREQQDPSAGFDILYEGVMHRILGVATQLVARVKNEVATHVQCKLTALTIVGQALVFRAARAAVMREMRWTHLSPTEIGLIQTELRRNVTAILRSEKAR